MRLYPSGLELPAVLPSNAITVYLMVVTLNGPPATASVAAVPWIYTIGSCVTLLAETSWPLELDVRGVN